MNWGEEWVELSTFILLLIGLIIALISKNAILTYFVAFLFGLIVGRFWYERKKDRKAPWIIIISGFIIGYTAGAYHGNRIITLIVLILGMILSNYAHKKKWIK